MPNKDMRGFTIVELLIVIVVIAILAAISIVAYTGVQNRTHDTAVQSDLNNIGKKVTEFQIIRERLPTSNADFTSMGLEASKASYGNHYVPSGSNGYNMAWCPNTAANTVAIVAASQSGNVYVFKEGAVSQGVGPLMTIQTLCSNNGHPTPGSYAWLFSNGSWQTYIGD